MMKEAIAWAIIVLCIATCTAAQADDLDVDSLCEKGLSFAAGENQDVELALKLMLEAAEAGSPACARHVGFSYLYGKGAAEENRELGLQWYATAGERGDVSALLEMAALYGTMNTFPDLFDPPRAESYAKQGAELGSPEAARVYLKMLLGRNVTEEEHISWLRKCAVETENSACMGEYAQVMIQGKYGHRVRLVKGLDMLHDAAERGDAPSLIEAGKLALKEDAAKAEKFFSKAAEKGYPGALFLLSRAYAARQDENGVTSEADFASETALLNLCARQHKDLQCLHLLGLYQVFGVGTLDVNATDGLSLLSEASRRGSAQSMTALATFFIDGFHVTPDHERALRMAHMAAEKGSKNAKKLVEDYSQNGGFKVRPIDHAYWSQMHRQIKPGPKRVEDLEDSTETGKALLPKLLAEPDEFTRKQMLEAHARWTNEQDPQAALELDGYLLENHHLRQSWLLMAQLAATGNSEGLFRAALKVANGMGVAKDFESSIKYMRAAASLGHTQAIERLEEYEANTAGSRSVSPNELHEML